MLRPKVTVLAPLSIRRAAVAAGLPLARLGAAAAALAFLALLALALVNRAASPGGAAGVNWSGGPVAVTPRPAPPLSLRRFDGAGWRLADRGRPALVNFWASWCAPCRDEAAALETAHRRYGDRIDVV